MVRNLIPDLEEFNKFKQLFNPFLGLIHLKQLVAVKLLAQVVECIKMRLTPNPNSFWIRWALTQVFSALSLSFRGI